MEYLIIEDEYHAAKRLRSLVSKVAPDSNCIATLDSVEDSVDWFNSNPTPDLAFFDIQLADGLSFNIFKEVRVDTPVIFTTAFDEYALKAFKTNSVDYLLKPIDEDELTAAIGKYKKLFGQTSTPMDESVINSLMRRLNTPDYVKRFLIKQGSSLSYVDVDNIAYFYSDDGLTFLVTTDRKKHNIDHTLDQVEEVVNPSTFFRINRKFVVNVNSVSKISTYFNSRLKLKLNPSAPDDAVVSREKVKRFKSWLVGG